MPEDKKPQQDPAEGSRDVIERQLKRQSSKTSQQTASEPSDEDRSKNQPGRDR